MDKLILQDIKKSYGNVKVLDELSICLDINGIVGILGLNGSGKTTLFNILGGLEKNYSGLILPDSYTDFIYMPTKNIMPINYNIKNVLDFYSAFMNNFDIMKAIEELEKVKINLNKRIINLSSGMQRQVIFILTMCTDAKVYLLDEPLTNLDINFREYIVNFLIEQSVNQKLFLIATHEIKEFENLFNKFILLKNGKFSKIYDSETVRKESGLSIEEYYRSICNDKKNN